MGREIVIIADRRTGEPIEATLDTDLDVKRLIAAESEWSPQRWRTLLHLIESGASQLPQHVFWNWVQKAMPVILSILQRGSPLLAYRFLGIEADGRMQGLMMVCLSHASQVSRLTPDEGKPLIYVEYLETAPWNAKEFAETPIFKGLGTRLIQAAIRMSIDEGFSGRVGLHALEQARAFYEGQFLMQSLGPDGDYEYFELTAIQAARILGNFD